MKKKIYISIIISVFFVINCTSESPDSSDVNNATEISVVQLTNETFKRMVFNYDLNKEWKYEGDKPAIIDFYADWCAPCRQLSPLVEQIAREYSGKLVVYKVDTEKEKILAQNLGITGLPTLLFIPAQGEPQMSMGLIPKESLVKAITEVLLIN